jgi:amidase
VTVSPEELQWLDATAQAELVAKGDVSPLELVEAAIERIDRLNPQLNAVIHRFDDEARATEPADGPFRGVPFLLKDGVAHSAGHPFHNGMRALKAAQHTEAIDSELVRRIRAAGFVLVGKTNLPELATTVTTEPVAYGPTRNPWDTSRSTGGSSGGAAAAVASGMVPVAHGNDMGGSIRFPASWCGLVGLKPTRARTSLAPNLGEFWGPLTHEHVLTRSVRDTAASLDALAGPAPGDPYTAPLPVRPWRDEVGAEPGRLRIRFRPDAGHPDVVTALEATAALLDELGHDVAPTAFGAIDDPRLGEGLAIILTSAIARELDRWGSRLGHTLTEDDVEPGNWLLATMGRATTAARYLEGVELLQTASRRIAEAWHGDEAIDVLMTATVPEPAIPLGTIGPDADVLTTMGRVTELVRFTMPFNATGQPAMSLPLHTTADGLPIGVQLVADSGREDVLIRLASQLEGAAPWAHRRPLVNQVTRL